MKRENEWTIIIRRKKKGKSVCVLRINKRFKANLRQSTGNTGELLPPVLCDPNNPTHIRHEWEQACIQNRDYMQTYTHRRTQTSHHIMWPVTVELDLKIAVVALVKVQSGAGSTQHMKAAKCIIEKGGSQPERRLLELNTIAAATAYIKSTTEHDAEPSGLPSSLHLSNPK